MDRVVVVVVVVAVVAHTPLSMDSVMTECKREKCLSDWTHSRWLP